MAIGMFRLRQCHVHAAHGFIRLPIDRVPHTGNGPNEVAVETALVAIAATAAERIITDHGGIVPDQRGVQYLVIDGQGMKVGGFLVDGAANGNVLIDLEAPRTGDVQNAGDRIAALLEMPADEELAAVEIGRGGGAEIPIARSDGKLLRLRIERRIQVGSAATEKHQQTNSD